jgi:hypothetical protein
MQACGPRDQRTASALWPLTSACEWSPQIAVRLPQRDLRLQIPCKYIRACFETTWGGSSLHVIYFLQQNIHFISLFISNKDIFGSLLTYRIIFSEYHVILTLILRVILIFRQIYWICAIPNNIYPYVEIIGKWVLMELLCKSVKCILLNRLKVQWGFIEENVRELQFYQNESPFHSVVYIVRYYISLFTRTYIVQLLYKACILSCQVSLVTELDSIVFHNSTKLKLNSMVGVRERTIPTERPPLVGEVIANFCG